MSAGKTVVLFKLQLHLGYQMNHSAAGCIEEGWAHLA